MSKNKKLPAKVNNKPVEPNLPLELSQFSNQNIKDMTILERNYLIMYLYVIRGFKQLSIAPLFEMTKASVSKIICELKQDKNIKSKLLSVWEKDISVEMRRKASQVAESIEPDKIPNGSKAQTAGILIDKARLLDGESTENVAVLTSDLSSIDREIADINRQLGVYE